ncbi:MAG TPA: PhzF family phenazine biosynthesis protein [Pseudonocardiaceae bacterium]|jgi:predicted PhzF superfamily epimerase YddE/YHI9|nr:PhzF family phenazine biosynthesis protein [Pseudonocardiaceae bacterium]
MSSTDPDRTLHVVKVFVGPDGTGGNPLGVFLDTPDVPAERRQQIAADLGFSETVFVADAVAGRLWIHTPATELPLAGHPLVGTSWLLAQAGRPVSVLRPPAGDVPTWTVEDRTWVRADPNWAPHFDLTQLATPAEVDAHPGAGPDAHLQVWAWEDEAAGRVRVRVFPTRMGIVEDEATGAAALRLGAVLSRPLVIRQGVGSEILVAPGPDGTVEVGGRVAPVETRSY